MRSEGHYNAAGRRALVSSERQLKIIFADRKGTETLGTPHVSLEQRIIDVAIDLYGQHIPGNAHREFFVFGDGRYHGARAMKITHLLQINTRDRRVASCGLYGGHQIKTGTECTEGCHLYEYEWEGQKKYYVAIHALDNDSGIQFFGVCDKADLKSLYRYLRRKARERTTKVEAPILPDGMLEDVEEFVTGFIRKANRYRQFGVRPIRGLLLDGPPGCGKTMLLRYLKEKCDQLGQAAHSVTSSGIESGMTHDNLVEVINQSPVCFFDDVDINFMSRRHDARKACALLAALDGVESLFSFHVRIFTTNEAVVDLDDAFLRPGRIDRRLSIPIPTDDLRHKFIRSWDHRVIEGIGERGVDELLRFSEGISFAKLGFVKSLLVANFFSTGQWDLDLALKNYSAFREADEQVAVGFESR
jgi:hypothetical protein